jgi:flagellar assembly protein FliH
LVAWAKPMSSSDHSKEVVRAWNVPEVKSGRGDSQMASNLTPSEKRERQEQLDRLKEAAQKEGLALGMAEAQKMLSTNTTTIANILNALTEPMQSIGDEVEKQLVDLAVAISRQIVRRELKLDPSQVIAVVREALSILPIASQGIRVYLHPEDSKLINEIIKLNATEQKWQLIDEPLMTRGGCRVETDSAQVDATIEARIASIAAEIMGGERQHDAE